MTAESDKSNEDDSDKIHSDAFNEAAAIIEQQDSGKPKNPDAGQGGGADKAAQIDDATRGNADNDDANEEGDGKTGEDKGGQDGDGQPDYKALYEKETQRTKSWEGRISKAEREARELREENERLKKAGKKTDSPADDVDNADSPDGPGDSDPMAGLTEEEKAALTELSTDYPVVHKALTAATKIAGKKAVSTEVVERVKKIESRIEEQDASQIESHFQTLEDAHPGFREEYVESGALTEWIESLPYKDAVVAKAVAEKGSTKAVLALFDDFAEATGRRPKGDPQPPNQQPSNPNKRRLESLTAVRRHSAKPAATGGGPSRDDFDGAFDRGAADNQR